MKTLKATIGRWRKNKLTLPDCPLVEELEGPVVHRHGVDVEKGAEGLRDDMDDISHGDAFVTVCDAFNSTFSSKHFDRFECCSIASSVYALNGKPYFEITRSILVWNHWQPVQSYASILFECHAAAIDWLKFCFYRFSLPIKIFCKYFFHYNSYCQWVTVFLSS